MNTFAINQALDKIQSTNQNKPLNNTNNKTSDGKDFASILKEKSSVSFSKHASARLENRNIDLDVSQMDRLNQATSMANKKNIKNSLVLIDDYAFIVNVPSSTVITAMDKNETKENVFTNIDGAVII